MIFRILPLLLILHLSLAARAQYPTQAAFNKAFLPVMEGFGKGFSNLQGEQTASIGDITMYACALELEGTVNARLYRDASLHKSNLSLTWEIAKGLSLEQGKEYYRRWQELLAGVDFGGDLLSLQEGTSDDRPDIGYWSKSYTWAHPDHIAPEYKEFRPDLRLEPELLGDKYHLKLTVEAGR